MRQSRFADQDAAARASFELFEVCWCKIKHAELSGALITLMLSMCSVARVMYCQSDFNGPVLSVSSTCGGAVRRAPREHDRKFHWERDKETSWQDGDALTPAQIHRTFVPRVCSSFLSQSSPNRVVHLWRSSEAGSESRYGRAHVCSIFRPRAGRWEPRRLAHRERAARACARVEQKKLLLENGLSLRRDVTPAAPRASGRGVGSHTQPADARVQCL